MDELALRRACARARPAVRVVCFGATGDLAVAARRRQRTRESVRLSTQRSLAHKSTTSSNYGKRAPERPSMAMRASPQAASS